jgi:hypothetical protein
MMRTIYGTISRMTTTPAGNATRWVTLFYQALLLPRWLTANVQLFDDYEDLQEHDRDVHAYSTDCRRGFQSESDLRHHLSSKLHQPRNVHCPGRGCNKSFVTAVALAEMGTCQSGMMREQPNRIIVRTDMNNDITNRALHRTKLKALVQ